MTLMRIGRSIVGGLLGANLLWSVVLTGGLASGTEAAEARSEAICIPLLKIQTDLPKDSFHLRSYPNMFTIAKHDADVILIYPQIPGFDIQKQYHVTEASFHARASGAPVYRLEKDGQASYVVDWKASMPFILSNMTGATDVNQDIERLIHGMRVGRCKDDPTLGQLAETETIDVIRGWLPTLPQDIQDDIEAAYQLQVYEIHHPAATEQQYKRYMGCKMFIAQTVFDRLTQDDIREVQRRLEKFDYLTVYAELLDSPEGFYAFLAAEYLYLRGVMEVGITKVQAADRAAPRIYSELMMGVLPPAQTACRDLPVPPKFKGLH